MPVFRGFTLKTPKAPKFNALAAAKRVLQRFKNSFNRLLRLRPADVRRCYDGIYDVELDHMRSSDSADARGCVVGCQDVMANLH